MNDDKTMASYVPMDTFPLESDLLPVKYSPYVNGKRSVLMVQVESDDSKAARAKDNTLEPIMIDSDEPQRYAGWLLFLDEMTSASQAVQAASYKLVLDKMVGTHNLHPKCFIVAAGNKASDKAIVNRTSTALQSRMTWIELAVDTKKWNDWAIQNNIDYRVRSYVGFKPGVLNSFKPEHVDLTFCCGRTLEALSSIIKPWKKIGREKMPLIAGTIGEGLGHEFFVYCDIFHKLPTIEMMLADPDKIEIPTESAMKWAFTGLISEYLTGQNVDILRKIIDRMPVEFQVLSMQASFRNDPSILSNPGVKTWITKNAGLMA